MTFIFKDVRSATLSKGVFFTVIPKCVIITIASKETDIIKSLFSVLYIIFNYI